MKTQILYAPQFYNRRIINNFGFSYLFINWCSTLNRGVFTFSSNNIFFLSICTKITNISTRIFDCISLPDSLVHVLMIAYNNGAWCGKKLLEIESICNEKSISSSSSNIENVFSLRDRLFTVIFDEKPMKKILFSIEND